MAESKLLFINGRPQLDIDGKLYEPFAYTTYFDECGEWEDFIKAGCRIFFVNVSFSSLPINNSTGFSPFLTGVFDTDEPGYEDFDKTAEKIISLCPDAFIFPRINIAMPRKWITEHPDDTVDTPSGKRECLFSDAFRREGARLLKKLILHIRSSSYAASVAGYQLCGGTTQEWFPFDLSGSYSLQGIKKFALWAEKKYGIPDIRIPSPEELRERDCEEVKKYYEFCSEMTADTISFFAKTLKDLISGEQIAGVFYGYNAFVSDPLWCHHALSKLITCPYIDFFSSPSAYDGGRKGGIDWGDMLPVDSLRLHNKLYFVECDIRTHLTKRMQDARPGVYPDGIYSLYDDNGNETVWCGPGNLQLSLSYIRKAFMHQLVKASGLWWFDMWGGWYHCKEIMAEIEKMHGIYEDALNKNTENLPDAETVVFIDEKAYRSLNRLSPLIHAVSNTRVAMGNTGIPFHIYMVEDAEKIRGRYRAAVFTAPVPSEEGKRALEICLDDGMQVLCAGKEKPCFSTDELRQFLISSGVHCYNSGGNVIYCSGGYLGIHLAVNKDTKILLPGRYRVRELSDNNESFVTDCIDIKGEMHGTRMFELFDCE